MADRKSIPSDFSGLQLSIQQNLSTKLSAPGLVSLPLSESYENSNLRFTEYKRPVNNPEAKSYAKKVGS
jgi:hypothetical protein